MLHGIISAGRRGASRPFRWTALGVAVTLVAQVALSGPAQASAKHAFAAPRPDLGTSVAVKAVHGTATKPAAEPKNFAPTATKWPAASISTINLAGSTGKRAYAQGGAVWSRPVAGGTAAYKGPVSVSVKVLPQSASAAAGIKGVLIQVAPVGDGRGNVQVGLDYSAFAQAYGGGYGSRLHLVQLPACALTTPNVSACRTATPLPSTNDAAAQSVSASVALGAAASSKAATPSGAARGGAVVIAAVSSASGGDGGGSGGQFGATSLKPSGSWSAGGSSGSFSYSYPVAVPPAVSSLVPSVGLNYDSGSVDGQTAATMAQSSWIGDGWSTADSFIEQSFVNCAGTPEGVTLPASEKTGDMCYDGPIVTMSLNGSSTSLVCAADCNSPGAVWKTQNGNGDVVQQVFTSSATSAKYNTDYWTVTTRDGTVYEFGRQQLPGWSAGDAATDSVDTEPVFSANAGDPCYSSAGFTASACSMAYRWHLDYVKDLHSNAMAYYYKQDSNYYGEDNGAKIVPYVRNSYLDHIDYGFTDGNAYGTVPERVSYATGERCVSGTCDPLNASNAANWPDVPVDLICSASTCTNYGPAFFSTVRLTSITTQQYNGSGYSTVDSWALNQTIPTTGTYNTSTLWLNSVTRTGADTAGGGSAVTAPAVTFTPVMLANRVNFSTGPGAGLGPLDRYRIGSVTTETGSVIGVDYELVDPCTASSIGSINPSTNTASCYPVTWTPSGYNTPYTDWFNKYAVKDVTQSDPSGGSPGLFTGYEYHGGAAWHYDDNEVVQAKYRTYGQFRGYGDVQTRTGQGSDPVTKAETWYYRGMDGDWLSASSTRSVTLTDSQGGHHTDANQLAGDPLESASYTYDGGPVDHSSISSYWVSGAIASRNRSGLPALTANVTGQVETWSRQAITSSSPPAWRTTETDVSFDADPADADFGLELYSYSHGDLALAGTATSQETCTQTRYVAPDTDLNLVGLTAETEVDDKPCGGTSPAGASAPTAAQTNALTAPASLDRTTDVISDDRDIYDDAADAGTWPQPSSITQPALTFGDASIEQEATGYSGGAFTYQTKSATIYDAYGRPVSSYDGDGRRTITAYTTTPYLTVTGITATNALGQSSTTTLDPARALTLTSADVNRVVTTVQYDGLGRTTAVWKDSRTTDLPANQKYTYTYPAKSTDPTVVAAQVLNDESGYDTTTTLFDALLRTREVQAPTPQGGRLISDTVYDSHGWTTTAHSDYWDSATTPGPDLVAVADTDAPNETRTSYDGLGRATVTESLDAGAVKQTAYAEYLGDRTITVPPTGAAASAKVTDALGRTTEADQYATTPTVATSTTGGFTTVSVTGGTTQATRYTFNAQGRAYQTIDAAGDTWTTSYDYLGRTIAKSDPDAGSTPVGSPDVYDVVGNLLQSTDSAGHTQSYTYDALNRKTAAYDATLAQQSTANKIASWAYDNSNNAVPGMANPIGHETTQTSYTPAGAFTVQAQGFNVFGSSLGEAYTVPGTTSLAGTYTYKHSYSDTTGLPKSNLIPAAGGMSQEILTTGYSTALDLPASLGGSNGYAQNVTYSALGKVAQEVIGSTANQAVLTDTYDRHTGALTDQNVVNTAVSSTPLDDTGYAYDASGNPVSETDTRAGTSSETQCFQYDPLDRLSQAWTTAGAASSSCTTTPTAANASSVVGDGVSGGAYWTSWSFNTLGEQTSQTQHALTSGAADTTTTYAYGGSAANCSGTSTGAHTMSSATTAGAASSANTYCYNGLGQTTSRTTPGGQQSLTWNDEGNLQTATINGKTSTYYYAASGGVIERTDPGTATLFLPDQQITLNTATGVLSNVRSYALPGGGSVIITNGTYGFELSDQHGTASVTLDSTLRKPVWKQYTPYGAPRGTAPGAGWLDPNGFLGKAVDTSDYLTTVGARQYDTALGRFVSLDPVLEGDPQELNGYTYAGGNPVTGADPTGEFCDGCGPDYYSGPGCSFDSNGFSNGNCDGQGTAAPTCQESPSCRAALAAQVAAKKAHDDAVRAALAAEEKAREEAAARARAEAAAANQQCAWYDVSCQLDVHGQEILEGLAIAVAVAAVVALCVLAPYVVLAAATAFGESLVVTGSLTMAGVAGIAAGVSVGAEAAGMATLATLSAVVADVAGGGAFLGSARSGMPPSGGAAVPPTSRGDAVSSYAAYTETPQQGEPLTVSDAEALRDWAATNAYTTGSVGSGKTWVAGYNVRTGQLGAACSGGGHCAEGNLTNELGGDVRDMWFTSAIERVKGTDVWEDKPVCPYCQLEYVTNQQFADNTNFDPRKVAR
jgi:RHS repeat-associated protein